MKLHQVVKNVLHRSVAITTRLLVNYRVAESTGLEAILTLYNLVDVEMLKYQPSGQ